VLKSFCSTQLVPFHNSVIAAAGSLPKANADVAVPKPPARVLAVFKSFTSVQFVPLYNSVFPVVGGVPPKAKADVLSAPAPT